MAFYGAFSALFLALGMRCQPFQGCPQLGVGDALGRIADTLGGLAGQLHTLAIPFGRHQRGCTLNKMRCKLPNASSA